MVTHTHTTDTYVGLNLLTADPSLEDCHVTESCLVVVHTHKSDTNAGLNPSHNNISVKDTPYTGTACNKENIVEKAKKQIGTAFGCLLLSTIKCFTGEVNPLTMTRFLTSLKLDRLVRQSGVPNFLGLRIPIPTQLKVDRWRYYLRDYFDQQLSDLIEFGFPLVFWDTPWAIILRLMNILIKWTGIYKRK